MIALSSAESELLALVRATCEGLGLQSLCKDLGIRLQAEVHVDASATLGIVERKGAGKLRHIDVRPLWLQSKEHRGDMQYHKIKGSCNPADMFTKNVTADVRTKHVRALGMEYQRGRATEAVELHR